MNINNKIERKHIAIIGRHRVGKTSLIKAIAGDYFSSLPDKNSESMEAIHRVLDFRPFGPICLNDIPGIDLPGELDSTRISSTVKAISSADFVVVVLEATERLTFEEKQIFRYLKDVAIPFVIVVNKIEFGVNPSLINEIRFLKVLHFEISCKESIGIESLVFKIGRQLANLSNSNYIRGLVKPGEIVVLVIPDVNGKARSHFVLSQIQTIKEALDENAIVIVLKEEEVDSILFNLKSQPSLIIADTDTITRIQKIANPAIKLTTYSILTANYKGDLTEFYRGLKKISDLKDGDKILISNICAEHEYEGAINIPKIESWLTLTTGKKLEIIESDNWEFPDNLSQFKLVIHCGGCSISRHFMLSRIREAKLLRVPIVNYGVLLTFMHNISEKVREPFLHSTSLVASK